MRVSPLRRHGNNPRERSPSVATSAGDDPIYRCILDSLDLGVARVSPDGNLLYANPWFLHAIGIPEPLAVSDTSLKSFIAAASWSSFESALQLAANGTVSGDMTVERSGLTTRTIRLSFRPLRLGRSTSIGIVALDVTDLTCAKRALEDSERALQLLSVRILRLQDEERRRIARDLHDVIGQELVVVSLSLDHLGKELRNSGSRAETTISECTNLLNKVQQEIRNLSYLLHPPMLEELGIASALGTFVEGFKKRSGMQIEFDAPDGFPRLAADKEIAVFRFVQESLTNVLRHSGSKIAQVHISATSDHVRVSVCDQGIGVPQDVLQSIRDRSAQTGVGIPGMRERLKQLRGTLDIHSTVNGTEILATLPLCNERCNVDFASESVSISSSRESTPVSPSPSNIPRKRVLIADDHEVTRKGLRSLLSRQPDMEVCGEAPDGLIAVSQVEQLHPDLAILDTSMPRAGGLYAAHMIREAGFRCKILLFAEHAFPQLERLIRAARCDGYVLKSSLSTDFLYAVRSVLAGQSYFSASEERVRSKAR